MNGNSLIMWLGILVVASMGAFYVGKPMYDRHNQQHAKIEQFMATMDQNMKVIQQWSKIVNDNASNAAKRIKELETKK